MKLLLDQNLSHRLPKQLADLFPHSVHVRSVGLDRASDEEIWDHAKVHGYCIVTQDADFAERSRLYGAPPKIIWLRCGNRTAQETEEIMRRGGVLIAALGGDPVMHCLELL